jgi:hypothetical protein
VAAFFCTLLVPGIICATALIIASHWIDPHSDDRFATILSWILTAYAAAAFWWARRLFLRAQDAGWSGGQISLTSVRGVSLRWLAFKFTRRQNRWTALVKKELQLQEITMFLVPILAFLHLALLAAYHFAPQRVSQDLVYFAVPSVWLAIVPFVIGCVAVAEERRLNTLESLLCLPASKLASFAVKFAVAMVLGIVLGGVIPWVLLHIANPAAAEGFEWQHAVEIAAAIAGMSFYASTMSRGLLQALPTFLCIAILVGTADNFHLRIRTGVGLFANGNHWIFSLLLLRVMIITFLWLSFRNYKQVQIGWRMWVGNFIRAGAVYGCTTLVAVVIFDRGWEWFMSLEPAHGPVRISGAGRATLAVSQSSPCVLLPDGRLWIGQIDPSWNSISGGFARGSNWTDLAVNQRGTIALQSDGTLWRILSKSDMRQIGSDSDWKKIAAGEALFLAVKQNGTLWGWGHDQSHILREYNKSHGIDYADPIRVGDDSDWVDVFMPRDQQAIMGIKRDGSAWELGYVEHGPNNVALQSVHRLVPWSMEGTNWSVIAGTFGIRTDGSLWTCRNRLPEVFGEFVRPYYSNKSLPATRVGTKSDWVSLSSWGRQFTALEADGTLWTMAFRGSVRPSKYTDWLAATQNYQYTLGLAKDGTLSCWDEFGTTDSSSGRPQDRKLMGNISLGSTRRPIFTANILADQQ